MGGMGTLAGGGGGPGLLFLPQPTGPYAVGAHLPGARSLDITRAYVLAFFDEHLRGEPRSLLDGPSARYPEVGFRFPRNEMQ